jgi:hypothetical protein
LGHGNAFHGKIPPNQLDEKKWRLDNRAISIIKSQAAIVSDADAQINSGMALPAQIF